MPATWSALASVVQHKCIANGDQVTANLYRSIRRAAKDVVLLSMSMPCFLMVHAAAATARPTTLRCDSLINPLGIDDPHPVFSWQMQSSGAGTRQSAYRVEVTTSGVNASAVWDSGRVASDKSLNINYAGPALKPETRYSWRVTTWDENGQSSASTEEASWETGLLKTSNWQAKWISYLEPEEAAVREADAPWIWTDGEDALHHAKKGVHDFRLTFDLKKPVARAVLFVTSKDLTSAWVNGQEVITAGPMPPWKQTAWGTYARQDVTGRLHSGANTVAVAADFPEVNPREASASMNATLLITSTDGTMTVFKSGPAWKGSVDEPAGWTAAGFDDSSWKPAVVTAKTSDPAFGRPWPTGAAKLLRKSFDVKSPFVSARLYVTALGSYEMRLNGARVGDQILAPGWTDYRERVPYQVYDVTSQVHPGANAIGAWLAPGWYSTPLMWFRQGNNYGSTPPSLMAQLRLEHKDGSVEWVMTDSTWKADVSPILQAEIYDGETFDATRIQSGWDTAAFRKADWKPVLIENPDEPVIESQAYQPIRDERLLTAKTITTPQPGVYIYDFGQNAAGVERLQMSGKRGTDIRLRFAEVLNPDGTMYVENLRTAKATDHYILAGSGQETYQPRFTFHGFRYVEITGVAEKPPLDAIKVVILHTNAPFTATLESGSSMVNKLWSNIVWGQRSNFVGVPTDCPQRDERLGWTADAQVFWRTATYNMDLASFSRKYSEDLRGTQAANSMYGIYAPGTTTQNAGFGPGWSDAGVVIPWTAWMQYGDQRVAKQNWDAMEKYLQSIQAQNPDYLWTKGIGIPYGDWLAPDERTSINLIATAYWAYDATRMAEMAHAMGKTADEQRYRAIFASIKQAFQQAYVKADGTVDGGKPADNGFSNIDTVGKPSATPGSQTGYVLALNMNLLPQELRAPAADKLLAKLESNGWRLGTGFLGTPYLLAVLSDTGHSDVAYRLLLNTGYPSWGYLIEHGATTTWERWNGDKMRNDPSMNSYNHYAYGAVADWIYRYAAGIDTVAEDPGYHTVYLHPHFDPRLGRLHVSYDSAYGKIDSAWEVKGNAGTWTVTLPANTVGKLPIEKDRYTLVSVNGSALDKSPLLHAAAHDAYDLQPGTYSFRFQQQ